MGSAPSPPPAPDPAQTAIAQGAANIDTAEAEQVINNTNQVTPYGSINYNQTGGKFVPTLGGGQQYIPQYTATTSLSPGMQQLFDTTLAIVRLPLILQAHLERMSSSSYRTTLT